MIPLFDLFSGVDGTALPAHTPNNGGPWVDDTPGWQLLGNQAAQAADNAKTHVEFSSRVAAAQVTFNLNGADPANQLQLDLSDAAQANGIRLIVLGTGQCEFLTEIGSSGLSDQFGYQPSCGINPVGVHVAKLVLGPDQVQCFIDGRLFGTAPRYLAKNLLITRFFVSTLARNALPDIKMLSVSVHT